MAHPTLQFAPAFEAELGIHVEPKDEIDCLVKGLAFIMGYVENEAYTFHGRFVYTDVQHLCQDDPQASVKLHAGPMLTGRCQASNILTSS